MRPPVETNAKARDEIPFQATSGATIRRRATIFTIPVIIWVATEAREPLALIVIMIMNPTVIPVSIDVELDLVRPLHLEAAVHIRQHAMIIAIPVIIWVVTVARETLVPDVTTVMSHAAFSVSIDVDRHIVRQPHLKAAVLGIIWMITKSSPTALFDLTIGLTRLAGQLRLLLNAD